MEQYKYTIHLQDPKDVLAYRTLCNIMSVQLMTVKAYLLTTRNPYFMCPDCTDHESMWSYANIPHNRVTRCQTFMWY